MGVAERKVRERAEREQRIVTAAREIAEREGWSAVTIRRLAEEIEYSQPVLYSHFENWDAIVTAVAVLGFSELANALSPTGQSGTFCEARSGNVTDIGGRCFSIRVRLNGANCRVQIEILVALQAR